MLASLSPNRFKRSVFIQSWICVCSVSPRFVSNPIVADNLIDNEIRLDLFDNRKLHLYFTHPLFFFFFFLTAAPDHWWWLLWPWHECPIGCVQDGTWQASLHWHFWQNDLGHCLRLQEPLTGLRRHKGRTIKEGKELKLWMDCRDGWNEGRDFVSLRWHVG